MRFISRIGRGDVILCALALAVLAAGATLVEPRIEDRPATTAARTHQARLDAAVPWGGALYAQFYRGARAVLRGDDPYRPTTQERLAPADQIQLNHPPTSLLPYLPMAVLPFGGATAVNIGLSVLVLCLACYLWARVLFPAKRWVPITCAVVWALWVPSWRLLMVGQNTALALGALAGWLWGVQSGHDRVAGLGLALAALKPHTALLPGLFALGVSAARRRRGVILAGLVTLLAMCAAITLAAPSSWAQYLDHLRELAPHQAYVSDGLASRGVLAFGAGFRWVAYGAFLVASVLTLVIGWRTSRHGQLATGLSIAATLSPCLTPHAYDYDLVFLVPFCVALVGLVLDRTRPLLVLPSHGWFLLGHFVLARHRLGLANLSSLWWIPWLGLAAQACGYPLAGLDRAPQEKPA
jgi:hypothetical protein